MTLRRMEVHPGRLGLRDGAWFVYTLAPQDGDGELVVRNLKTGADSRYARGRGALITADSRFVVYAIAPPKADVDKAKKEKKKPEDQPKSGLGVLTLSTGEVFTADRVKSFRIAEDAGGFVAYLLEAPIKKADEKKEAGVIRAEARAGGGQEAEREEEGPGHGPRDSRSASGVAPRWRKSSSSPGRRTATGSPTPRLRRRRLRETARPADGGRLDKDAGIGPRPL